MSKERSFGDGWDWVTVEKVTTVLAEAGEPLEVEESVSWDKEKKKFFKYRLGENVFSGVVKSICKMSDESI